MPITLKWFNRIKCVDNFISSTAQTSQAGSNASTAYIVKEPDTNTLHKW